MKYLFGSMSVILILALTFGLSQSSLRNTTGFFAKQVGYELNYQSYSGYEDIEQYYPAGTASIYYSLWQGYNELWSDKTVPLIIWLQGGPGGASQFGCFEEIGPLHIEKINNKVIENPWSWNSFGHIMCVDQPVGVGFSFNNNSKKVIDTPTAAKHFVNFLTNFFKNNPSFGLSTNPLYISGESYAGHYIPAIAEYILANPSFNINLKGVLIGDGYIDPQLQINNYDSYLSSVGVVSNEWRDTTGFMQVQALRRIEQGNYKDASNYTNFIISDLDVAAKYYQGMNVLNYKQYDDGNINPNYYKYLQSNKAQFGVPDFVNYVDDNQEMYYAFCDDFSRSFRRHLERILDGNIRTLIYNGQNDFIVNTAGVLTMMNTLQWRYAAQWKKVEKKQYYKFSVESMGWYKNYRNLIFMVIRDAGHLVPSDQPRTAWFMLQQYFYGSLW